MQCRVPSKGQDVDEGGMHVDHPKLWPTIENPFDSIGNIGIYICSGIENGNYYLSFRV